MHSETFWVPMMKRLWPMYFALPLEKRDVHVCSFEAIWSGNWAAAYFRYICKVTYEEILRHINFVQFILFYTIILS